MVYIISTDLVIAKGYLRSVIYDLTRESYNYIPNDIADIMLSGKGFENIDTTYFSWLMENEYILEVPESTVSNLPPLNTTWEYPADILTLTCSSEVLETHMPIILEIIKSLQIPSIAIIDTGKSSMISAFLAKLEISSVQVVEWLTTYQDNIDYIAYTQQYPQLKSIIIYESLEENEYYGGDGFSNIVYKTYTYDERQRYRQHPSYFNVNTELITESMTYHTYFNRRLHIAGDGTLFQSPTSQKKIGCLSTSVTVSDIRKCIRKANKIGLARVHKGMIDICKDCEHRFMCVDNREPKERENGGWYHEKECNYNPYIARWDMEEEYQPLHECGIHSDEHGFSFDTDVLKTVIQKLWGA